MYVIVIGCGRVGAELAIRLAQRGHSVAVVDHQASAFNNLNHNYRGRTIEGEALNRDVLERAGIEKADGLAAVTNSDPLNAVVAHVARNVYNVANVVVRNYDPHWRRLHQSFGVQHVSSTHWGAQRIEEMLYHGELRTVFSAGNGEVEIYEFSIPAGLTGTRLGELIASEFCAPVSITRAGVASLAGCDDLLQEGDIVLVSATLDGVQDMRARLNKAKEI